MPHWNFDETFDKASWSPDGKTIAFYAEADGGAFTGIFVVGVNGKQRRLIIDSGLDPAWSPDGRMIAYEIDNHIGVATAGGKNQRRIVLRSRSGPPHAPRHPDWSADGRKIVFADDEKQEIWIADRNGAAAHRIIAAHLIKQAYVASPAWQPRHR